MNGGVSTTGALFTAIAAVVVAVIGLYAGWRNSGRASMSADQREWLKTALSEARQAKTDAGAAETAAQKATTAANSATRRAEGAERRLSAVETQTEELIGWIGRVVRAANDVDPRHVNDPQVSRLLAVVNGGPPSLTSGNINKNRPS